MGLTLFGYIFRDLLKVFSLAAFVISGIMSFAGLLRPLTERGLAADQAGLILAWLLPAMMVYSLPVAALFATTFVYGRLASDNEITAIRAAGVPTGIFGVAFPAFVLGIGSAFISLVLLCFIVPAANLQVERTVYSNLARLAANEINRSKRFQFDGGGGRFTVNADRAVLLTVDQLPPAAQQMAERASGFGLSPETQIVRFENVYVMKYRDVSGNNGVYEVPAEIFTAEAANAFIEPPQSQKVGDWRERIFESGLRSDQFLLTVTLEGGMNFPRDLQQVGVEGKTPSILAVQASQIGPIELNSGVRENAKFLSIRELHTLLNDPAISRRIGEILSGFVKRNQQQRYLEQLITVAGERVVELSSGNDQFTFYLDNVRQDWADPEMNLQALPGGRIELQHRRDVVSRIGMTRETVTVRSERATVTATPLQTPEGVKLVIEWTFPEARVTIEREGEPAELSEGRAFSRRAVIDMPEQLARLSQISPQEYLAQAQAEDQLGPRDAARLRAKLLVQSNGVKSEIHARLSFSLSCLLLPIAGGLLGMFFRSGNFLTAFAVSVIPAVLSIVLVVVGQQVAESLPGYIEADFDNPMGAGIALIWSGNIAIAMLTGTLLWKLRR